MEITLSREQFETLLNAVYLGTWMVNAIRQPENEVREFAEFEKHLLSLAHGSGFADRVEFDPTLHQFSYASQFEEALQPFIDEYKDNVFWDGLVDRLAHRDFEETYGEAVERMDQDERLKKLHVFVDKYETEFDEHGIDRLKVMAAEW